MSFPEVSPHELEHTDPKAPTVLKAPDFLSDEAKRLYEKLLGMATIQTSEYSTGSGMVSYAFNRFTDDMRWYYSEPTHRELEMMSPEQRRRLVRVHFENIVNWDNLDIFKYTFDANRIIKKLFDEPDVCEQLFDCVWEDRSEALLLDIRDKWLNEIAELDDLLPRIELYKVLLSEKGNNPSILQKRKNALISIKEVVGGGVEIPETVWKLQELISKHRKRLDIIKTCLRIIHYWEHQSRLVAKYAHYLDANTFADEINRIVGDDRISSALNQALIDWWSKHLGEPARILDTQIVEEYLTFDALQQEIVEQADKPERLIKILDNIHSRIRSLEKEHSEHRSDEGAMNEFVRVLELFFSALDRMRNSESE
jgi:hypothetical protein